MQVMWLLETLEGARATDTLLAVLRSRRQPDDARERAALYLASPHHVRRALRPLLAVLRSRNRYPPVLRERAAYALGWFLDDRALPPLVRTLEDATEAPTVRAQAAESLGLNADCHPSARLPARLVPVLLAALEDPHAAVRFWAAYALGSVHDKSVIPFLERQLGDETVVPSWWSAGKEAADSIAALRGWFADRAVEEEEEQQQQEEVAGAKNSA